MERSLVQIETGVKPLSSVVSECKAVVEIRLLYS